MKRLVTHASIFDAEFLMEQLDILVESAVFGSKAYSSVGAVGGPAPGAGNGVVSQGNDVDNGGSDGLRPAGGQRNVRERWVTQW